MIPITLRRALPCVLLVSCLPLSSGCQSHSPFGPYPRQYATASRMTYDDTIHRAYPDAPMASRDSAPALADDASLAEYQRYAAYNNPGLRAQFHSWQAAVEMIPQARALPDPRLTYGYYLGEVETRVGPMQHSMTLAQTFPLSGKLDDRADAAMQRASVFFEQLEAARLHLAWRVERSFNELYYLKQSIDRTSDTLDLLLQTEQIIEMRYRLADSAHADLIRVQVQIGQLEDRLQGLQHARVPMIAQFNALLHRPADAAIAWPATISNRSSEAPVQDLIDLMDDRNPELIALSHEIEEQRINTTIAQKDGIPDLTVGLVYTNIAHRTGVSIDENGDDAVLATFSINLPIWRDKYDAGVRAAIARRLSAAGARSDRMNQLIGELHQSLFDQQDAQRRIALYESTLIPKAMESLEATFAAFEQGDATYLDLTSTQDTLLEFQLSLERARVDRANAASTIERLIGATLPDVAEDSGDSGDSGTSVREEDHTS